MATNDRLEQFKADVADLKLRTGATGRENLLLGLGIVLMVAGIVVALVAYQVSLNQNDPRDVADIIQLSRATYRKMVQNLGWAVGYNVIALPLAAGVLAVVGFVLAPAVGAALMSLSTIIVAINAQTLRGLRLGTSRTERR